MGAGPAGCAAAISARRAGLTVKIVEARSRLQGAPGETLHPGIEPLFETLGVRQALLAARFHRHRGVWVQWNEPCRFEPYGADASGPWLGFQANRLRLHGLLLAAAHGLGASIERNARAEALLMDGTRVAGIVAAGREIFARWTADATGRSAWLARALRLAGSRHSPRLFARFGWRDGADPDSDGQPRIVATPEGWQWHAPLGDVSIAWVSLTVDDASDRRRRAGVDVSWRSNQPSAGSGYFLLGDAAVTLDPLSSHGVLRASMSGMLCAHMIAAHSAGVVTAVQATAGYAAWMREQFEYGASALRTLYQKHPTRAVALSFQRCPVAAAIPGTPDARRAATPEIRTLVGHLGSEATAADLR